MSNASEKYNTKLRKRHSVEKSLLIDRSLTEKMAGILYDRIPDPVKENLWPQHLAELVSAMHTLYVLARDSK